MEAIFSQIPEDLPAWAWIIVILVVCIAIYFVAKLSRSNKKQSNNISGSTIRDSKFSQKNTSNNESE